MLVVWTDAGGKQGQGRCRGVYVWMCVFVWEANALPQQNENRTQSHEWACCPLFALQMYAQTDSKTDTRPLFAFTAFTSSWITMPFPQHLKTNERWNSVPVLGGGGRGGGQPFSPPFCSSPSYTPLVQPVWAEVSRAEASRARRTAARLNPFTLRCWKWHQYSLTAAGCLPLSLLLLSLSFLCSSLPPSSACLLPCWVHVGWGAGWKEGRKEGREGKGKGETVRGTQGDKKAIRRQPLFLPVKNI